MHRPPVGDERRVARGGDVEARVDERSVQIEEVRSRSRHAARVYSTTSSFSRRERSRVRARWRARANGALGDRELVRDLLEAEVEVVVRNDDVAVVLGELLQRIADAGVALACSTPTSTCVTSLSFMLGSVASSSQSRPSTTRARGRRRERMSISASFAVTRKSHVEKLDSGAERSEAPDDLHERRLEEVAAVFVTHRIPQELTLDMRSDHPEDVVEGSGVTGDSAVEDVACDGEGHDDPPPEGSSVATSLIATVVPTPSVRPRP